MAYVGLTNVTIAQGGAADFLYATYAALTSASWVTLGSGTGAAGGYSSSGSLITSAATFNSAGAWARMREPGGVGAREYIFQRTAATTGIIKYSRSDGFVSGSPAAATAPTTGATGDGKVIVGTGTDASPTAATLCGSSGYVQAVASNTATNGTYGFWTFQYTAGTGTFGGIFLTEGISPGSTPASDADPSWRLAVASSTWWSNASPGVSWWQGYNLAGETYITAGNLGFPGSSANTMTTAVTTMSPTANTPFGVDPYDAKVSFFPFYIGKSATYPKGFSSGISFGLTSQNNLDVFNIATSEPRIAVNSVNNGSLPMPLIVVPWVPNIIPVV
jgi:hypothetical protein